MSDNKSLLKIEDLLIQFGGLKAISDVNIHIDEGEFVGIIGPNGAGKTTMMRMLCTLLKPTSGSITCNGKDIFEMDSEYRNLLG